MMPAELVDEGRIRNVLSKTKSIAVVGASAKPWRDSGRAVEFLAARGYEVFPVNPRYPEVNGRPCYPTIAAIGKPVDMVDVFRNPDELGPIVDECITLGIKLLWLQYGVINEAEQVRAEAAGIDVVVDRCIMVDYRFLMS